MKHPATKRADAVTNRAHILDVAQSVFVEYGLDLEVSEVAMRANLGIGTLYRHFANREDLLRAILLHVIEDALAQMQSALASASDDPCTMLQTLVFAGLRIQQQYRPLFVVIRDPRLTKLLASQGQSLRARFLEVPKEVINHGIKAGIFREDLDQDIAAATIIGSFTGTFDLLGIQHSSLDELTQRLYRLLLMMVTRKTEM